MQFELSRRKDTAEKLFLIYEYVGKVDIRNQTTYFLRLK